MNIKKVEIKNFKFHKYLEFSLNKKNCLIYGENGTGKSSIYWALISVFKSHLIEDINQYKNYNTDDDIDIKIHMDNNIVFSYGNEYDDIKNSANSIYFANQNFLEKVITIDNFFDVLNNLLSDNFSKINTFITNLNRYNEEVNEENHIEIVKNRQSTIKDFEKFLDLLRLKANDIINRYFEEQFTISFSYNWGNLDTSSLNYKFENPQINIYIDNKSNIRTNFNEAKLKLTSLAIFFALIKLEENLDNSIKLLVLDDFLTSLDMGNRKFVVRYIIENFKKYQIFILTHNLQFFNLLYRFLNYRNLSSKWNIKNIFLTNNDSIAIIYDKKINFVKEAQQKLDEGEYQIAGNLARKEFERIVNELKKVLELGKQEELTIIINTIKKNLDNKLYFKEPFEVLSNMNKRINKIEKVLDKNKTPDNRKIVQIKNQLNELNKEINDKKYEEELKNLKSVISNTEFYKDTIFNPSSHNNSEIDIYKKECESAIGLLEYMNEILNKINKTNE